MANVSVAADNATGPVTTGPAVLRRRSIDLGAWLGVLPFIAFALLFLIIPTLFLVGVAVLSHGRVPEPESWHELFPELMSRLSGVPAGRLRGAGPFEQRARGVLAPGVALVGDAAGYLDALSGEGLALGFCSALALVRRFATGELRRYARDYRRLVASYERSTRILLALARRPRWRALAVRYLSRHPELFSALLAVSVRSPPVSATLPRLVYRLLSAPGA